MITNKKLQAMVGTCDHATIIAYFFNCIYNGWDHDLFIKYPHTRIKCIKARDYFKENHPDLLDELNEGVRMHG